MPYESVLTLKKYIVNNVSFSLNHSFKKYGEPINIVPNFKRIITKIDEDNASVKLLLKIDENEETPFSINIEIEGFFVLPKWEDKNHIKIMEINTVAILFPYLRTLVTTITSNANIPPYFLPVVNVQDLFERK